MARTKEFEPEIVLGHAMHLFWERGYGKSSMDDLLTRMRVGRRSLYDTFGDKHALFVRALDMYTTHREQVEQDVAAAAPDSRSAIRELLRASLVEGAVDKRGCLAVNSATEVSPQDAEVARNLKRHFAATRALLQQVIDRGRRDGSVTSALQTETLSTLLFNAWLGLRVQIRAGTGVSEADIDAMLSLLD
jgi:TetR/AcrR family transcriptional repressor of nem operon